MTGERSSVRVQTPAEAGEALLLLRAMRAELDEMHATLEHFVRRSLEREDRRTGAALLPLVHERFGDKPFTGPALFAGVLNDLAPAGRALLELIVERDAEDTGLRAFGKLLARLDGVPLGGYRLVPAGERRDGRAWRVLRVSGPGNPHL